ncbi:MAG: heparan-alpha-glucosaminide N-acetyltransferase domain-containing protein, partial [Bacteroidota bacterium]
MTAQRLYFIDAVRAFAILMMLQGHFIDTLLDVSYRDPNHMVFSCWKYFRGITAPIFFTISGLIFTYLLIRAKRQGKVYFRMRKGIMRGLLLIGIGYMLRIPILEWFTGVFNTYFLVVDVLQCIGVSLIAIVLIYALCLQRTLIFSILMLLAGMVIFLTEPLYRNLGLEDTPILFANYMTKANGSIFTILPWFGYMAFGAFIATLFYGYLERPRFKVMIIAGFIFFGIQLIHFSGYLLNELYYITDIQLFEDVAYYNYLFKRL